MPDRTITLATRGSKLALAQATLTAEALRAAHPEAEVVVREYVTTGDKQTEWSLEAEGGKGLFTKEIEEALLRGEADIAVHSAKDLPTEEPSGLTIAGFLPREQAHDILILRDGVQTPKMIASGSPRRRAQLKAIYPKAVWSELRGNVETRLKKIARGDADATVLAAAGLARLGIKSFTGLAFKPLGVREVVPAAGQGAIALQVRTGEESLLGSVNHGATLDAVRLERQFLGAMGGGCHAATAAHVIGKTLLVFHDTTGFREYNLNGDGPPAHERIPGICTELLGEHSPE
ncbi:MAG: hydroxymethylbilane synthase [Opitutales bacterium]